MSGRRLSAKLSFTIPAVLAVAVFLLLPVGYLLSRSFVSKAGEITGAA
jgi:ABC-type sugar transport system permease subunit